MKKELILYTHPMSRGRTVRWILEEIGCAYQTKLLEYDTTMNAPEYLNINPLGKVPALRHGDTIITESAAICAYLADAFPEANLAPPLTSPLRGTYYRWFFFAAGPLEMAMINQTMGVKVTTEQKKTVGYGDMDTMLTMLEDQLSQNDYLLGENFSAVDIYVGAVLGWFIYAKMIKSNDTFTLYLDRLQARPAAIRANKIDDDLLA